MKTENKLIAEFMGMTAHHQDKGCMIFMTPQGHNDIVYVNDLEYHTSWDWLMPVVEKIDDMFGEDDSVDNGINRVHNAVLTFDINQVYGHVVDFINEYNKKK
jgi:hypothetical protein